MAPPAHAVRRPQMSPRRPATARPRLVFMASLVLFFLMFSAWSLGTPVAGSPDEPNHIIKAVAVAHGQFLGQQPDGPGSPFVVVKAPQFYIDTGKVPECFAFKNTVPASCEPALQGSAKPAPVAIYTGRYPPLYYLLVGIPSLFTTSTAGVYLMRLVSGLLSSLMLALAVASVVAWSRSRFLLAGVAVAATPSLFFFGGVVNPSGFEIACAICLWCSGLLLVLERAAAPPRGLVAVVAVSGSLFVLVRGLSPLWLAMIGVTLLALCDRRSLVSLLRSRSVQVAGAVLVAVGGVAVAWIFGAHTLDVLPSINLAAKGTPTTTIYMTVFDNTGRFLTEMIGKFGWLDTLSPAGTYLAWYGAIGGILLIGAALAGRRRALVLVAVVAATVVVPVLISASHVRTAGYVWQGKDTLPFAVGVPLVAAALAGCAEPFRSYRTRMTAILALVLAVASVFAFAAFLRRDAVGLLGPHDFFGRGWQPPLGNLGLFVGYAVVALLGASMYTALVATTPVAPGHDAPAPVAAGDASREGAADEMSERADQLARRDSWR